MADLFAGVNWMAVVVGVIASFIAGWIWYSPKGFYTGWAASARVTREENEPMGAMFGSLVLGLVLVGLFVGVMMARGQLGPLLLGVAAYVVMGYSNNAFKKLGPYARNVDAGSWLLSAALMIGAQLVL